MMNFGAEDRNRTGTEISFRRILSPLRLPVPPPRHNITILCKLGTAYKPPSASLLLRSSLQRTNQYASVPVLIAPSIWQFLSSSWHLVICIHAMIFMEAAPRFELGSKGFADLCLTTWLCRLMFGAENEIRTRDPRLGKAMLYR